MYTSSVIARGKAALQGSETEQRIAVLLYDDTVQVISSFELNQLASLTYHDSSSVITSQQDMTDILIDHLEQIQSQPVNYSVVSVQKSLVVTKHILLVGAEKVVPCIKQQLGRHVEALCQYNTVLLAQQQAGAWLMRLKGGGVDKGGPVRDVAVAIYNLLINPQQLQLERSKSADPNSLVPIGNRQQVAFCTDEVRLEQLKKRMHEQQTVMTRSNLAKASDGFGSGYMAANGKTVVGAAHGIEEMLRQQQKEEQRFSDEASAAAARSSSADAFAFSEYQAPSLYEYSTTSQQQQQQSQPVLEEVDLLTMDHSSIPSTTTATADLLDFGSPTMSSSSNTLQQPQHIHTQDLLFGSTAAVPASTDDYTSTSTHDPFQVVSANIATTTVTMHPPSSFAPSGSVHAKQSVMSSNADRFAALDVLASVGSSPTMTTTSSSFAGLGTYAAAAGPAPAAAASSFNALTDLSGLTATLPMMTQQQQQPFVVPVSLSSIKVSQQLGNESENSGSGFLMGGTTGTGLAPLGQAPAAPPPPPPPGAFY
jgi:ENTH domain